MKLSEKNVLIATGIMFLIVIAILNFSSKENAEQIMKKPSMEITSSSYTANGGKLTLKAEETPNEFELSRIMIIDKNNNSFSSEPTWQNDYKILDTYIPELTSGDILKIELEEAISTKGLKVEYKISGNSSSTI